MVVVVYSDVTGSAACAHGSRWTRAPIIPTGSRPGFMSWKT